jgi:glycerol kinase
VNDVKKLEAEALTVKDSGDVYFVPAFQGIFSPHWRGDARAIMIGMSLNTERGHLMRALIEGPLYRSTEIVHAMAKDIGVPIESMVVDGGMTVNNLMMQTQADLMNAYIIRKEEKEITAMGAAIAAGLQVKYWESLSDVESKIKV